MHARVKNGHLESSLYMHVFGRIAYIFNRGGGGRVMSLITLKIYIKDPAS